VCLQGCTSCPPPRALLRGGVWGVLVPVRTVTRCCPMDAGGLAEATHAHPTPCVPTLQGLPRRARNPYAPTRSTRYEPPALPAQQDACIAHKQGAAPPRTRAAVSHLGISTAAAIPLATGCDDAAAHARLVRGHLTAWQNQPLPPSGCASAGVPAEGPYPTEW